MLMWLILRGPTSQLLFLVPDLVWNPKVNVSYYASMLSGAQDQRAITTLLRLPKTKQKTKKQYHYGIAVIQTRTSVVLVNPQLHECWEATTKNTNVPQSSVRALNHYSLSTHIINSHEKLMLPPPVFINRAVIRFNFISDPIGWSIIGNPQLRPCLKWEVFVKSYNIVSYPRA